jgi:hypothetical protein
MEQAGTPVEMVLFSLPQFGAVAWLRGIST